ncbi:MAG TPA: gamma-glutamylcyclotransferase family protein [Myxococcota bacterium]|nr:gamma-glutamylcyclotransferase family protein [Myxococcota bacterium]
MSASHPSPGTSHLFVYGTLRRGAAMHALLDPGAEWVGPARMRGRLYDLGAFPGFADGRVGEWVKGELYRLTGDPAVLLDALDRYEGRAYRREVREAVRDGGDRVPAFVYCFAGSLRGRHRIESGDYLNESIGRGQQASRPTGDGG